MRSKINNLKVIFIISLFLFLSIFVIASISKDNYSNPDSEFSSQKKISLNITKQDGFEEFIDINIFQINETRFAIGYSLNDSISNDIKNFERIESENKGGIKDNVASRLKRKYYDVSSISDEALTNSLKNIEKYPVKNLSKNLRINKNELNLSESGIFYVDLIGDNLEEMIGEELKIGYNTIVIEVVEEVNDIGYYSSLAIDSNGNIWIAHYDATNGDLRVCNNVPSFFICDIVDSVGDVGLYPNLAIDSNDKVSVCYYDNTGNNLKYANNTAISGTWSNTTIDSAGDVGKDCAIAIDSNDRRHIVYYDGTTEAQKYCNDTSGTSYSCGFISDFGNPGSFSSIAIDPNDKVHTLCIIGAGNGVRYSNNVAGSWSLDDINSTAGVGYYTSIAIDSNNVKHVCFQWNAVEHLIYGNNTNGIWSFKDIKSGGWRCSISLDRYDNPWITHYYVGNIEICNNTASDKSWSCGILSSTVIYSGNPNGRNLAIKQGRLSDFPGIFSEQFHVSFKYNNTALYYIENNLDSSIPTISILFPTNNTNQSSQTTNVNFTISDNFAIDSCWYSNDSYSSNISLGSGGVCSNITSVLWIEGPHNVTIWGNDTTGNEGHSQVTFAVDFTKPVAFISTPTNNTNISNNLLDINYTASDLNLDACWYSNDTYTSNLSLGSGGTCANITNVTWSEGQHNVTIYLNDSSNNLNYTKVSFRIDSTSPTTTAFGILQNGSSYNFGDLVNQNVKVSLVAVDSGVGMNHTKYPLYCTDSLNTCIPDTFIGSFVEFTSEGIYYMRYYSNDSINNNETIQSKTIKISKTYPSINIEYPVNNSYNSSNILDVNFTITSESGLDACWYSLDSYASNLSLGSGGTYANITNVTWSEGQHNVTIWANDTFGIENSTSISFVIDLSPPEINIDIPTSQNYGNNNSINLNYTSNDLGIGIKECWYYVINSSDSLIVSTTLLSSCQNTTFSLPGSDTDYTLYLFSSDLFNHVSFSTSSFGIRTGIPVVVLSPINNTHRNYQNNHYFNFSVTTLSSGIDTCELWGNWTTGWHLNQTLTSVSTSSSNNFSSISLNEGHYFWNVLCNDTNNNFAWAFRNNTFVVDLTKPIITSINITPFTGFQTFNFNVSVTDINIEYASCKYSIYDLNGNINGLNVNVSFNCNEQSSATATSFGTFNFTAYATDKAGNENSSSQKFTLVSGAAPSGGGGGGTTAPQRTSTICVVQNTEAEDKYDLQRCIIYARIREYCLGKINCALEKTSIEELLNKLSGQLVRINESELNLWIDSYNKNDLEVLKMLESDVIRYNLFTGILQIEGLKFSVTPSRLDPFYIFFFPPNTLVQLASLQTRANRNLKSFTLLKGSDEEINLYKISDAVIEAKLNTTDLGSDFSSKVFMANVEYISTDDDTAFQEINLRVINPTHPTNLFIIILILFFILMIILFRKRLNKLINFIKKKLNIKNK